MRSVARPVAPRKMSGHGRVSGSVPFTRKKARTATATTSKPGDAAGKEVGEGAIAAGVPEAGVDRGPVEDKAENEHRCTAPGHEPIGCLEFTEVHVGPFPDYLPDYLPEHLLSRLRRQTPPCVFGHTDHRQNVVAPDEAARRITTRVGAVCRRAGGRLSTLCAVPTALLSVYDKTGVVDFARALREMGWSIVSSGGTAKAIAAEGIDVTDVADLTGVPAILSHRVVTLHPKVHGGILADPTDPEHLSDMAEYGIEPISLVVGNLYPFGQGLDDFEHGSGSAVEMIDIGGPAMVRAAAKNHAHVAVIVEPKSYDPVIAELRADGALSVDTKRRLARAAFAHTAAYDAAIVTWFDDNDPDVADETIEVDDRPRRQAPFRHRFTSPSRRRSHCATARTRTKKVRGTAKLARLAGGIR